MKNTLLLTLLLGVLLPSTVNGQKSTADTSGNKPDRYAVVVGISDYQDETIPDLRFADKDAEAFAAFLQSPAGGALDEDHLKVLINEQATAAQFAIALDWLMEVVKEDDKALIYFSGHGDVERKTITQPGYFLCWDAPSRVYMAGGALALPIFQDVVSTLSIQNKAKVIVVSDACRSGKLSGSSVGGSQLTNSNLAKQYANEIKILSCQPDEYSIEGEQWGGGRGAFSYHLLDGLTGMADDDEDYTVTLREIRSYLEENVSEEVDPQQQLPIVVGNGREKLTDVFPDILNQLKEGKKGQLQLFTATASKGIEDEVLAAADSNIVEMYLVFQQSLKDKQFLEPAKACSDFYYAVLSEESQLEQLHSSMRRNYAAALQDDAQQVMNNILNQNVKEAILSSKSKREKYDAYPSYLERAAELLGDAHYMHDILMARKLYFEGRLTSLRTDFPDKKTKGLAALEKYKAAIELQPEMPHAYLAMMGIFFSHLNQLDSAEHYFHLTTSLVPSWIYPYTSMAVRYSNINQFEKAMAYLNQAIEMDSNSVFVLRAQMIYYTALGEYEKSIKYGLKAIQIDSTYTYTISSLAEAYFRGFNFEKAEEYYLKAIHLDSTRYNLYSDLGRVYSSKKQFEKAEEYYKKGIHFNPLSTNARTYLGYFYTQRSRNDEAIAQFEAAIKIDSTRYLPYLNLCFLNLRLENWEEMTKHCSNCIEKGADFDYPRYFLAYSYLKRGLLDEAKLEFERSLKIDPADPLALAGLACLYRKDGLVKKAEAYQKRFDDYQISSEGKMKEGQREEILLNACAIFIEFAQYPDAEKVIRKVLDHNPESYNGILAMIDVQCLQKNTKEAIATLEKAIKMDYSYSDIQSNSRLDNIRNTEEFKALMQQYFPDQFEK